MINTVAFVVVLVVSMIDSSQAVTCYQCNYTRSPPSNFNGNCGSYPNPYSRTTQRICSAPVCSWMLSNYANPTSSAVKTDCVNTTGATPSDSCAQYRSQYNVTNYANYCCYSTRSGGAPYYVTNCFCQTDFCQENIPESVGTPTFTPSTSPPPPPSPPAGSTMSLLNPTFWALTFVAITAMVAVIGG